VKRLWWTFLDYFWPKILISTDPGEKVQTMLAIQLKRDGTIVMLREYTVKP
jgi:hypothetical protein